MERSNESPKIKIQKLSQETSGSGRETASVDDSVVGVHAEGHHPKGHPGSDMLQASSLTITDAIPALLCSDDTAPATAHHDTATPTGIRSDHVLSNSDIQQQDDSPPSTLTEVDLACAFPPYFMKEAHEKLVDLNVFMATLRGEPIKFKTGKETEDHTQYVLRLAMETLLLLNEYGVCVFEDFLPSDLASRIAIDGENFNYNYSAGMKKSIKQSGPRRLNICPGGLTVEVAGAMKSSLPLTVLMTKFFALVHVCAKVHTGTKVKDAAVYKAGPFLEFYPDSNERHPLQQHNLTDDGRFLTAVYYLNKNWDRRRHGGQLMFYPSSRNYPPVEIGPFCNRAVLYWSDMRNAHEVLPTRKNRYAVTVCYYLKEALDEYQTLGSKQRS